MISEYLQRDFVLSELRTLRQHLTSLVGKLESSDPAARRTAAANLKKHGVTRAQIQRAIEALDASLKLAGKEKASDKGAAYIPTDPVTCSLQAAWTQQAMQSGMVLPAAPQKTRTVRGARGARRAAASPPAEDASPQFRLAPARTRARGTAVRRARIGGFEEGDDIRYGLDGFTAKLGLLFRGRRKFNNNPARAASGDKPLRLFLFGDWGTGLPLAAHVTGAIRQQLAAADGSRRQHVIHLGDVYYAGEKDEYRDRMLSQNLWPVTEAAAAKTGSWSLNGNHDMYTGGYGYFDTLLKAAPFRPWHSDKQGKPSSFFVIEDPHWQVFGLDTSWNIPSLGQAVFGDPTIKDYGGQNGILTPEQVAWMKSVRDPARGCILLTHHQPAASHSDEAQHSDEAVALLESAGLYRNIDAWIWGHEHRAAVFKPKARRTDPRLKKAPAFCCCLGHGGVPVSAKNFAAAKRKPDVEWEEDRLDATSPLYEGHPIVPFGFGRLDTAPGKFEFKIFDHTGSERYSTSVTREP